MAVATGGYVGRFAPTPSGPLHLGSLVAALGSYVDARAAGGAWLLRIDDLDTPRVAAGAADAIQRTLERHGLWWDGPVHYQSDRRERYADALADLTARGALYPCRCSRRELARVARRGPLGLVYPGTCRAAAAPADEPVAWRLALAGSPLRVHDSVRGPYTLHPGRDIGDVVVRRRDGLPAYHLATTVDDADLGVTAVVRGLDLLPAAAIQTALAARLGLPAVRWCHLPLAQTADGAKLSKATGATALDPGTPVANLLAAWAVLGQPAPAVPPPAPTAFLAWATTAWDRSRLPVDAAAC